MHFGSATIPVAGLTGLGVAPEHRNQGLGTHLLRAAESRMAIGGALVGVLRTSLPHFFRRSGWALCGQASCRRADARALLARLLARGLIPRPRRRLHIRPWLQWEQAGLARLYNQNVLPVGTDHAGSAAGDAAMAGWRGPLGHQPHASRAIAYGPLERTSSYWHWLVNRHGYDQLYVALDGPQQLELGEISTRIVGYAVTRGEQILELMAAPDCPRAAVELLARCCGDAIEHDRHCVLLHAPPWSPLFEIFDEAGGCGPPRAAEREVYMMRLLDPLELLRQLCDQFERRAAAAHLSRPLDLGLLREGQKFQLELGRDGVAATSQRLGRSYLRLNVADFTRLVLGQLDWEAAIVDGRLECSTALAREAGRVLFPAIPLWRPPWDDAPAIADQIAEGE